MGRKRSYDWGTKVAAASAMVDSERSKPDVMSLVGLSSVAHAFCLRTTAENGIPFKSSDSDPNPNDGPYDSFRVYRLYEHDDRTQPVHAGEHPFVVIVPACAAESSVLKSARIASALLPSCNGAEPPEMFTLSRCASGSFAVMLQNGSVIMPGVISPTPSSSNSTRPLPRSCT